MVVVSLQVSKRIFDTDAIMAGWTVGSRKTHQTIVNMLAEYNH